MDVSVNCFEDQLITGVPLRLITSHGDSTTFSNDVEVGVSNPCMCVVCMS